jgi:hypothetical protein
MAAPCTEAAAARAPVAAGKFFTPCLASIFNRAEPERAIAIVIRILGRNRRKNILF